MAQHNHRGDSGKEETNNGHSAGDSPDAVGGNDGPTAGKGSIAEQDTSGKVRRRSILKFAGVAAAVGVAGTSNFAQLGEASVDVSSGNGYEVWTISGKEVYDLSDGEELSNVLIDQTADGACLTIRSRNKTNWTVRNVGFLGVGQMGDGSNGFQFQVSAPSGGNGLIENIWANGKARNGQPGSQLGGIYIRSSHAGHLDVRHTYIEGFGNNAIYASAVGKDGGNEGSVAIENSYHRDNTSSQFRIGSPNSSVKNCVGVINDPDGERGPYPGTTSNRNARGIWGKHFRDQRIENVAFYVSPDDVNPDGAFEARYITDRSHGEKAVVESSGCEVNADAPILTGTTSNAEVNFANLGESPTVSVIEGGVPTSPEMAAEGGREMPPEVPGATDTTDGDTTSDVTSLSYGSDAVSVHADHYDTADSAGVEFSMTNTASQALTVTGVTVAPLDSSINELHDESNAVGRWTSEIHVDADTQNGVCDVPGSSALPATVDMANDGWDDAADDVAIMSAGSAASVALSRFEVDGSPMDMTGKEVDIEIGYQLDDGTTSTDSFTVSPGDANSVPSVEGLSMAEVETDDADAEFDVDWQVSDADGDLNAVALTLIDETDGKTEGTETVDVSGKTASKQVRLVAAGDDVSGNDFAVELTVTDGTGATASDTTSLTESDPDPVVATGELSSLTDSSVTLSGSLTDLGTADSVDVAFQWRKATASAWNDTATETLATTGSFNREVSDLSADSTYEYRAIANASDGRSTTGAITEFSTDVALARTLTIDGADTGRTDYEIAVSGDIENDPDNGSMGIGDSIEGSTATGFVNGGIDGYRFSGEIVGITVDGDAAIFVDDQAVAVDSLLLPNTVVFDADGSSMETVYSFEVSGDLVNDPLIGDAEDSDTVEKGTVTGTVTGDDQDGFRFAGNLVSLRLDGDASVIFEDTDG